MSDATTLLSDELKSWIGREVSYPAREELGRASIRYFAMALQDDNPLYRDDAHAQAAGYPSVVAPPTFVVETCQYADGPPNHHGYIGHNWDLPIEGCRMIRAGNAYEFMRPVLPSDRVSVTWTLEDIVERPSSRGGTQLFVTSVARHYDDGGELLAVNRETLVYQPLGDGK
ncbi:MAG: MaoC family dehydratase N-terminal domain-containing protein [Alphaproteobacteria bacterium]|jgi:acyl dehydratase|nr:MaoC family dehydratase N-terminal domain-containing protein [Alphaproteobacteria bacterium]MDP6815368.1 MaoC family dehydratase N-terminal domain-containing protein [Alphaproteobacteria bacterium]